MRKVVEKRRFRFSLRSLMVVIALCAFVLALGIMWVRQRDALRREQVARAIAQREKYLAELLRAQSASREAAAAQAAHPEVAASASEAQGGLWAALSVNHPVFRQGETKDLNIEFTLVNDGDQALDPKLGDSQILINGKELADSGLILNNGPRDARFEALPPGDHLRFGYALGSHFLEPGIYRVSWRGANFKSPEVVFRVLSDIGGSVPRKSER